MTDNEKNTGFTESGADSVGAADSRAADGGAANGSAVGGGAAVSNLRERAENFWFYHKWHLLIGVLVVVMLTVLTLQTCSRAEYDVHVLYAGSHRLERTSSDGNLPTYTTAVTTLKKFSSDYNGDGEVMIDLRDLYVMTQSEIRDVLEKNPDANVNEQLIMEDGETLASTLLYSEYFLVFISDELFKHYEEKYDGALFEEIAQFTDTGSGIEYEYASERGIYLGSLPFHEEAEFCKMPSDTVVCIRKLSEVASSFNKDTNTRHYERSVDMLKKILSDR